LTEEEKTRAQEVVGTIARRTGRVDILVNNAGMAQNGKQPGNTTVERIGYVDWQRPVGD